VLHVVITPIYKELAPFSFLSAGEDPGRPHSWCYVL